MKEALTIPMPRVKNSTDAIADDLLYPIWVNNVQNSTIYFVSYIDQIYPGLPVSDKLRNFELKPKMTRRLPHRYFKVHTRDGSPAKVHYFTHFSAI